VRELVRTLKQNFFQGQRDLKILFVVYASEIASKGGKTSKTRVSNIPKRGFTLVRLVFKALRRIRSQTKPKLLAKF
jgi:hypothetical protein